MTLCLGLPGWAGTRRNIHPLTSILVIGHPLSTSFIYYDPQHPLCSVYMPDSPFPQPLSRSSLAFLLVWAHLLLHTTYISSPSHHLLFTTHAHTNAACSDVVPMLCLLFVTSLSQPPTWKSACHVNVHRSTWLFLSLIAKLPSHVVSLQARLTSKQLTSYA